MLYANGMVRNWLEKLLVCKLIYDNGFRGTRIGLGFFGGGLRENQPKTQHINCAAQIFLVNGVRHNTIHFEQCGAVMVVGAVWWIFLCTPNSGVWIPRVNADYTSRM